MTDEGIKKCFGLLQGAYKAFYKDYTTNDWVLMKEVWQMQFGNCEDLDVFAALGQAISECDYPPSIAKVKKIMVPEVSINEEEEWKLLLKASRNNLQFAQEEWEKLPEDFKKVTTPYTLVEIGRADDESVRFIKKDIMAAYRKVKEKSREDLLISFNKVPQLEMK